MKRRRIGKRLVGALLLRTAYILPASANKAALLTSNGSIARLAASRTCLSQKRGWRIRPVVAAPVALRRGVKAVGYG